MWPFNKQTPKTFHPNSRYEWPPSDPEQASEWSYEHAFDAIAYAAGWSGSGEGYGPDQADKEWPDVPGFDFEDGVPDWSEIKEEAGYEYRTVLSAVAPVAERTKDGWELVRSFGVNPEPELYDESGSPTGVLYIGEENRESVYRRPEQD